MEISNFTSELAAAAAPLTTPPPVPAPVLPVANALPAQTDQQTAPENFTQAAPLPAAASPATTTPVLDKFHQGVNTAAANTPPSEQGKPGMWAKQILAGVTHMFSGAQTALGDVAAAEDKPGNRGILGGVGAVQEARAGRQAAQRKEAGEEQLRAAQIGKINVDTHYSEMLLHSLQGKLADQANDDAIANGKNIIALATTPISANGETVPVARTIQADISEAELQQALVAKDPVTGKPSWDPNAETFWPSGKTLVYENGKQKVDDNGNPLWAKTYTIISTPPSITLDDTTAKFLNDNIAGSKFQAGTIIPGATALMQFQQANNNHALLQKQQEERDEADLKAATTEQKLAQVQAAKNLGPNFFQYAAQADLDLNKLMTFITGKHLTPQPEIGPDGKPTGRVTPQVDPRSAEYAQKYPNAGNDLINFMGGLKDYTTIRDSQVAEAETERKDRADEAAKSKAEQDKKTADLNDQIDAFGNKSTLSDKEFNKRYDAFTNSQQNKTLQTLQGSYQQFQNILGDIAQGKMTGAESVVGLFNAIGISATPLAGKGFRINSNTIDEHVGARGLDQAAIAKLQKLDTGAVITPEQMKDYAKIALDVYKSAYVNAANEQLRTLHYTDVLPRGNNQTIDPVTAGMYLQVAGGNPQIAAQAAVKQGWQATPANFSGTQQATANTHVFNAQTWAAANPGKDLNAAIAAAKAQGYQVKQ